MELTPEQVAKWSEVRASLQRTIESIDAVLRDNEPPTTAYAVGKAGDAIRLTLEVDGCAVTLRVQHTDEELRSTGELHATKRASLWSAGIIEMYRARGGQVWVYVLGSARTEDQRHFTLAFPTPEAARQACLDIIACVEEFNASRSASK